MSIVVLSYTSASLHPTELSDEQRVEERKEHGNQDKAADWYHMSSCPGMNTSQCYNHLSGNEDTERIQANGEHVDERAG